MWEIYKTVAAWVLILEFVLGVIVMIVSDSDEKSVRKK